LAVRGFRPIPLTSSSDHVLLAAAGVLVVTLGI
jgi:hypothetical protein